MFSDLNVFKLAHAVATHAGQRQAVIARNLANADTPGYQPREIEAFQAAYSQGGRRMRMSATREGHMNVEAQDGQAWAEYTLESRQDANGNGVSLEEEMLKAVDVKRQHDRALAIYRSSLTILRTSIGKV
ncbi:flagellar biosynthesis protein FlgB [Ruegeria marisrubri]|uniref:Flagellar biosynthesis protein FlgB n=2 Tax=Ruegeria marisrubri TaxID=1685379 RepID=A0A0X3TQE2_9RHOB|nr:FlgB family protein [Ruegeria marisrubri]KUJ77972.1 flagellar biosynthesis protein FlgB [Ruegeria marisrubri]